MDTFVGSVHRFSYGFLMSAWRTLEPWVSQVNPFSLDRPSQGLIHFTDPCNSQLQFSLLSLSSATARLLECLPLAVPSVWRGGLAWAPGSDLPGVSSRRRFFTTSVASCSPSPDTHTASPKVCALMLCFPSWKLSPSIAGFHPPRPPFLCGHLFQPVAERRGPVGPGRAPGDTSFHWNQSWELATCP